MYIHLTLVPVHRPRGRAQDEADPALGQRAAAHRHPARHAAVPLGVRARPRHPQARSRSSPRSVTSRSSRPRTWTTSTRSRSGSASRASTSSSSSTSPSTRPSVDLAGVARDHRARRRRPDARADRARGQVRPARGRVPVGQRGAAPLGLPPRRATSRSTGSTPRRSRTTPRRSGAWPAADGILVPGGFGGRGIEGKIRAVRVARERADPVPRDLPGHADRGLRVRAPRRRHAGRQLDRVRHRDRVPGDRPPARAEGGHRPRRHDAPRRRPDQAAPRHARARASTARPSSTSATATATRSRSRLRKRLEAAGLVVSGTSPDERLVEVIELRRPPVLRRLAVPPRVQVAPRAPRAALPRLRGRRPGAGARARRGELEPAAGGEVRAARARADAATPAGQRAVRPASEVERRRLNELFAELCAIPSPSRRERAVADRVARRAAGARPRGRRGRRGRSDGRRARQPARAAARAARSGPSLLCAHLDTVPHEGADRARARRRRLGERGRHDPRRRQQGGGRGAARARAPRGGRGLARRGRAALHGRRGGRAGGRHGLRRLGACAPSSATSSTTRRRSARSSSRRRPTTACEADFRGTAAHAGIRPEDGRSAILAAARAIAAMPLGRIDEETTANVGVDRTAASRRDQRRPRALPVRRRGALAHRRRGRGRRRRDGRPTATTRPTTRPASATSTSPCERCFAGYRHATARAGRSRRRGGAARVRLHAAPDPQRRRPRTPTRSRPRACTCIEPRQRHRAQPRADRARQPGRARGDARRDARAPRRLAE